MDPVPVRPPPSTPSREAADPFARSFAGRGVARLGIAGRVFVGTAAIVCAVLAAAFAVATASLRRAADEADRRGLEQAADLVAQFLAGRERSLAGGASVFAKGPYFRALVAGKRRDDILDQAFEAAEQLDADWVFITDDGGRLIAKSDEPAAGGDALGGVPLVSGALQGRVTSGFGVSRDTLLFQAVAVPVAVPGAAPVGVLVATRLVDSVLARDVKAATASDVLFYTLDAAGEPRIAASTLTDATELRASLASLVAAPAATSESGAGRLAVPRVTLGGTRYAAQGATTTTAGGAVVGGFVVLRAVGDELPGLAGVRRSVVAALALGLVLALGAAYLAARRVTRPVRALADVARRAADGEYDAAATLGASGGGDEIAALTAAFRALVADLRDREALIALRGAAPLAPAAGRLPDADDAGVTGPSHRATPRLALTRGMGRAALAAPHGWRSAGHPDTPLEPGSVLAERYAIQATLGAGGMGVVYRAVDLVLGETVAVKVLRPGLLAADPLARERLKDELRLARRISHRNVVRTHDFGESAGVPFITMEYVDGASLDALIRAGGAVPAPAVLSIAKQLCRALRVAHEQGVIHGDLKPQNLLVRPGGVLKVTDFGVARLVRAQREAPARSAEDRPRLAGAVVGTPEYMAPEQLLGEEPSVHSDLYAMGVVLRECLTGVTPFAADTPLAFFSHKLEVAASPPVHPGLAAWAARRSRSGTDAWADALDAVVERLTARDPDERPASADALHDLLARLG